MENHEILALYDQDERRNAEYTWSRREVLPRVVRHIPNDGIGEGFVLYSNVDADTVDAEIEAQIAYFESLGMGFEWKIYDYDNPPDLKERLTARGFEIGEEEALLILPLDEAPPVLLAPITHDIRRITDPARIDDVVAVERTTWTWDFDSIGERLRQDLREAPDQVSIYVAYDGDKPVSCAWMYYTQNSRFAGMWGGTTDPAYRGKGYYTQLVAVRLQEARERGKQFLTIDASPMSRPIVTKLGFRFMALTYPAEWKLEKA